MLVANILDQVRRDTASFADPGTVVEISDRSLSWVRSRITYTAQLLRRPTGFPDVSIGGREYTYTAFLASEALADLKDLAATISTTAQPPHNYIAGYATKRSDDDGATAASDAPDLIANQTLEQNALPLAATRILFVHGNAGTGKTSTLLQLTKRQADRYLQGETGTLFLYLDAQGKGLSQLEDVMARALQDLRAKFTYHSVAALTRRHCVVPIVDGFDELIGPSSAREAFANLAQFLAQLDCEGALIASSRSAFIDYRTLHERAAEIAASQNLSYEIVPVELLPWADAAIEQYCRDRSPGSLELREKIFHLLAAPEGSLVRKPFFLSQVCEIYLRGGTIDASVDIIGQIVQAALVRDASKLRDQRGRELLTPDQHRRFCEYLADEMWSLSKPELDVETIRLNAELCADEFHLDPRDAKTLVDRSVAHGLLTVVPGIRAERRVFEHELFRFEFQASSLARLLIANGQNLRDYINRGEVPWDVVARIPLFGLSDSQGIAKAIEVLTTAVARSPNAQFAPVNAGSVAAALLFGRQDVPAGLRLHSFYLRAQVLRDARIERADIRNCLFERVDLTGAQFIECSLEGSQFVGCVVGENTRFDRTQVDVWRFSGIVQLQGDNRIEVYDPAKIRRFLEHAGALLPAEQELTEDVPAAVQARAELIERLLKHARSHYYLSRDDPWYKSNLEGHPQWASVEQLLKSHSLMENVKLSKSGRPEVFLKLAIASDKILQARVKADEKTPANVVQFWRDVLSGP